MQTSLLVHAAAPFCRSLYANLAGIPHGHRFTHLSPDSIVDINMWRALLVFAWRDSRCLSVHMSVPPLLARGREELATALATRQAAVADIVGHGDAAGCGDTVGTFGCGFVNHLRRSGEMVLWGGWSIPYVTDHTVGLTVSSSSSSPDLPNASRKSINFYEAISMVIQLDATCRSISEYRAAVAEERARDPSFPPTQSDRPLHLHLWTDNSSALCWLTKHKSLTPLNAYVIQLFSHIQARHQVLVTVGHVPGKANVLADAVSRNFRVPNGDQMREQLSTVPRVIPLPLWWQSLLRTASSCASTTSALDHATRTTQG